MIDIRDHGGIYSESSSSGGNFGGIGDFQTMFEPYEESYPKIIHASERRVKEMIKNGGLFPSWIHLYVPFTQENKWENTINLGKVKNFNIIGEDNIVATKNKVYQLKHDGPEEIEVFDYKGDIEEQREFMSVDKSSDYLFGLSGNHTLKCYKKDGGSYKEIHVVGDAASEKITGSYGNSVSVEIVGSDRTGFIMIVYNTKEIINMYNLHFEEKNVVLTGLYTSEQSKSFNYVKGHANINFISMKNEGKIVFIKSGIESPVGVVYDLNRKKFTTDEPYNILKIPDDFNFREISSFRNSNMGGKEIKENSNGVYMFRLLVAVGSGGREGRDTNFVWDSQEEVFYLDFEKVDEGIDDILNPSNIYGTVDFENYPNKNMSINVSSTPYSSRTKSWKDDLGIKLLSKNAYSFLFKAKESALSTDVYASYQEDCTYGLTFVFGSGDTHTKYNVIRIIPGKGGEFGLLLYDVNTFYFIKSKHVKVAYSLGKTVLNLELYVQPMFTVEGNPETGVVRKIKRAL